MEKKELILLDGEDLMGLYVNGKLRYQAGIMHMGTLLAEAVGSTEGLWFGVRQSYMTRLGEGGFPEDFEEIPQAVLIPFPKEFARDL